MALDTPTPTDPREEKLTIRDCIMRRFAKVATPTWEALCQLEADEISKGKALEIIRDEAELMERENWKLLQTENAELESTNSKLAAEIAELRADKERLDWLEAQTRKSPTGISFDWVPKCEDDPSGFRFMRRFFIGSPAYKLRDAIDFAKEDSQLRSAIKSASNPE